MVSGLGTTSRYSTHCQLTISEVQTTTSQVDFLKKSLYKLMAANTHKIKGLSKSGISKSVMESKR